MMPDISAPGAGFALLIVNLQEKKKSIHIAKAGEYLKPMMVQYTLSAIKSKKQPYFAVKYNAIKNGVGTKNHYYHSPYDDNLHLAYDF